MRSLSRVAFQMLMDKAKAPTPSPGQHALDPTAHTPEEWDCNCQ